MWKTTSVLLIFLLAATLNAQSKADPSLLAEINKIKAIDNHAHPLKYIAEGEKADDEYDALPLDVMEPFPLPVRLNPANAEFIRAWHDLYGYRHDDISDAHRRELMGAKQRALKERGRAFRRGYWINLISKLCLPIAWRWDAV